MYRAIGDASFQDGVFSRGAERQAYQASVQQFADGSLGRVQSSAPHYIRRRPMPLPGKYTHRVTDLGLVQSSAPHYIRRRPMPLPGKYTHRVTDLSSQNTYLPAFTPQQMQGLGYVFRDGVLGEDTTIPGVTISTTPAAPAKWTPDLASLGIGVIAGGLLFYALKH